MRETMPSFTWHRVSVVGWNDATLAPDDPRREGRYGLPPEFLSLKDVILEETDGRVTYPLKKLGYDKFKEMSQVRVAGLPLYFKLEIGATDTSSVIPGDISLFPLPSRAFTLKVAIYQKPTRLAESADGDTYELPEALHLSVVYYACIQLAMRNADRQRMEYLENLYMETRKMDETTVARADRSGQDEIQNPYGPSKSYFRRRR
jgi:hypothetical protein